MALDLKLKISTTNDCKNLVIQDITGIYSPESNPGGWGGFNISGNRQNFNIQVGLIVHHFIDGEQYNTPISVSNFESTVYYPSEDTFRGFKVSIPSYDISSEISLNTSIPEQYDAMQEVVEDTLYEIQVRIFNQLGSYNEVFNFQFRSVCNSQNAVDKMMGLINLGCEDCDDSDIEKALLAKSLLESLKKIN